MVNSYSSIKAPVPTSPKPEGLEADSSQAGLQMEAVTVGSSLQHPDHRGEDSVSWWRGTNSTLQVTSKLGSNKRPRRGVLGQGWDQVKHTKKTLKTKNAKNTEKRENTNTCDLSKVLPSEPRRQALQQGPRCQGLGAWQLHPAPVGKKQYSRYALPPGSAPASLPPLASRQVTLTFCNLFPEPLSFKGLSFASF